MKKVTLAGKKAGRRRWLAAATAAARAVAEDWRSRCERDRISEEILLPCQTEGPAGTDLTGCGKVRVPPPGGEHGTVFRLTRDPGGHVVLAFLAFGLRHPPGGSAPRRVPDLLAG